VPFVSVDGCVPHLEVWPEFEGTTNDEREQRGLPTFTAEVHRGGPRWTGQRSSTYPRYAAAPAAEPRDLGKRARRRAAAAAGDPPAAPQADVVNALPVVPPQADTRAPPAWRGCLVALPAAALPAAEHPGRVAALPGAWGKRTSNNKDTIAAADADAAVTAVTEAEPPLAVCHVGPLDRRSWRPWQLPLTMAYHRLDPQLLLRPTPPAPLGQDGAWLPVVHTTALISPGGNWWRSPSSHVARERGLWFYYAAGCSDLFYDAGRTLAARNRVDAAVQIAERLGLGGAAYVAAWINATMLQARRGTSSLYKPRYLNALGDGGALIQRLEAVVKEAARWPFYPNTLNSSNSSSEGCDGEGCGNAQSSGRQAPIARAAYTGAGAFCEPTFASMTDAKSERQRAACTGACALLELAACLLLFEFIDDFLLEYGPRGLDSVQLLMQPQAGYTFFTQKMQHKWAVEVLDLRGVQRRSASIEKRPLELLRHLRGVDGQPCKPACFFRCCMACKGSPHTLQACHDSRSQFRTQPYWQKPKNGSTLRWGEVWSPPESPGVRHEVALCGAKCTEGMAGSSRVLRDDFAFLLNHSYTGWWGQGRHSWRADWGPR